MFKDYKEILKDLRNMQDQMWKDSMASFPGSAFPQGMDDWQQTTLENVNTLVGKAVGQSLDLQREWLGQWTERASSKKLKPKYFAELSTEASHSTQRWLDNQRQLWDQWLEVLKASGGKDSLPGFDAWEKALEESIQRQMSLLKDWSDMASVEKLSVKEATKLSNRIEKAMEKSIETQQRLWSHWFDDLGAFGDAVKEAVEAKPEKKKPKAEAKPKKADTPSKKSAGSGDDLKQISGIGPGLEKKLNDFGISSLEQLAQLSDDDIKRVEEEVIRFSGRIKRDKWVEQAKKLVS